MKPHKTIFILLMPLVFGSCVATHQVPQPVVLEPVSIVINESIKPYTYFYITSTEVKTSSSGSVYGNEYGVYGSSSSRSTNPADIISGNLIKKGLIRLPDLKSELADKTMIINYGETGRRNTGGGGYTIEITLQMVSAKTNQVICVLTGEGQGKTEADDIRIAINRCLEELYRQ
ncbi:MAG: hypothetical protein K5864_04250 [Bacteroidales bacterium]|nr:hypothetical protein [Bacteroidales bacterium]